MSILDYLSKLFGGNPRGGAPAGPMAGSVQPTAAFLDPSTMRLPMMPGDPANVGGSTLPMTPQDASAASLSSLAAPSSPQGPGNALPQMAAASPQPDQLSAPTMAGPSSLAVSLPQQQLGGAPSAPPIAPVHGWLVNALDKGVLGGAIAAHDAQALGAAQAQYRYGQMKAFAQSLPSDDLRQAFWADPQGFMGVWEGNLKRADVKAGDTSLNPATNAAYTAPQFDDKSGAFVQPTAGGIAATPSVGGDFASKDGVIYSQRTGAPSASISQPQAVPAGARPGSFTPQVTAPGSVSASLPQLPAASSGAPTAIGVPAPADIATLLPGAKVTSGYRLPQKNAAVGGVPNSWHTAGSPDAPGALDLAPPTGVPMGVFANTVRSKLPTARVLNEGNHVHVQPNATNTGQVAPTGQEAPGWSLAPAQPQWTAPAFNAKTNRMEQTNVATGEVRDAGAGTFNPQTAKQDLAKSDQYTSYTAANDAFKAMLSAAALAPGGMRAYALRDTFARLINPGAVARVGTIQAIEQAQGVPANIKAYLLNLRGDGNVPAEIAQQILDVSHGFLQAHYGSARQLNDSYAQQAVRSGLNPADATVPMENMPGNVHLALPPKNQLTAGDIYMTSRGPAVWNGQGFAAYGR